MVLDILLDIGILREKNISFIVFSCVPHLLKASMREQETAATVQDVEVRRMELESQRQLFEQVIIRELTIQMLIFNGYSFAVLRSSCVHSTRLCEEKGSLFFSFSSLIPLFRINPLLIKALVELTFFCFFLGENTHILPVLFCCAEVAFGCCRF